MDDARAPLDVSKSAGRLFAPVLDKELREWLVAEVPGPSLDVRDQLRLVAADALFRHARVPEWMLDHAVSLPGFVVAGSGLRTAWPGPEFPSVRLALAAEVGYAFRYLTWRTGADDDRWYDLRSRSRARSESLAFEPAALLHIDLTAAWLAARAAL